MQLDIIKTQTTWNDAAASLNNNFSKINRAVRDGIPVVNTPVDEDMSNTSTNAVQNKVIKKYVDDRDVYLKGYAEGVANDAEAAAKKYTDEKIAQIGGGGGGSGNGGDFEVRTVYPTKQTIFEEETLDITEEERAYNIETLSKTLSGKTVFCKVGEAILFPTISMSGVVTEATYSTVVVLEGSLASYSLTIMSNGDAEVVIADVTTGGGGGGSIDPTLLEGYMPMMREFSDDFNDDFAR